MAEPQQQGKGGGLIGNIGGWFPKILIILAVIILFFAVLTGSVKSIADGILTALKIGIGLLIIFLVAKGLMAYFAPKPYSPTEDFKEKIIRAGKMRKPFNVKRLFIRGEDMMVYSKWFNISGILFLPYISARIKTDSEGKVKYHPLLTEQGKQAVDPRTKEPVFEPEHEILTEKDGEWCFIGETGFFIFKKTTIVRAHYSLCSAIGESIFIKTPNLVPIGDYFYPAQQWQEDIMHVMAQHKAEAIVMSYENFLDLVANVAQMALGGDPTFNKILQTQAESLGNRNTGIMQQQ